MRLLNYQNNLISKITNLANLPNLIFLDLYNNLIDTLEGPLSAMSALRVVMVGKNRIEKVTRLTTVRIGLVRTYLLSIVFVQTMSCSWDSSVTTQQ